MDGRSAANAGSRFAAAPLFPAPRLCRYTAGSVGAWRSLVAHLHGVQGVAGSNPVAPTIEFGSRGNNR